MMNEERWARLRKTFDNPENFEKVEGEWGTEEWYTAGAPGESNIEGQLMDWLECSSTCPDYKMIREFQDHGYRVYAGDRDSFGWLTGIVRDEITGRRICFG